MMYYQTGRGMAVFRGMPIQRGRGLGGVLSGLFRKTMVPLAKAAGKSLLKKGAAKAVNVLNDIAQGQPIKTALFGQQQRKKRVTGAVRKQQKLQSKKKRVTTKKRRDIFD